MWDAKGVAGRWDVGDVEEFRFRCSTVSDFNFEVEGRNARERDRNNVFAIVLNRAETVSFSWVREAGCWSRIYTLAKKDGRKALGVVIVVAISQLVELVFIQASFCCFELDGSCAQGSVELTLAK
jgi:hypothetical protein